MYVFVNRMRVILFLRAIFLYYDRIECVPSAYSTYSAVHLVSHKLSQTVTQAARLTIVSILPTVGLHKSVVRCDELKLCAVRCNWITLFFFRNNACRPFDRAGGVFNFISARHWPYTENPFMLTSSVTPWTGVQCFTCPKFYSLSYISSSLWDHIFWYLFHCVLLILSSS